MNIIDFPIERINEFLKDHSFVLNDVFGTHSLKGDVTVKIKLTGIKPMISFGEWKNYIEYTLILEEVDDQHLKTIFGYVFAAAKTDEYVVSNTDTKFYTMTTQVNKLLREFLAYWGIDNYVTCTKIIDKITNIDPKYMTEGIINENKYSNVVRQVVKDILRVFKYQKEGDYYLPEDIGDDEHEMVYDFPQLKSTFTVELNMNLNDDINTVDVDGEYFRDDDTIVVRIESNPNLERETLEELYFELNELIAHELQHLVQRDSGYKFPRKEPKKSLKYYTQPHELEAQVTGFKRRAKKERRPFRDVVINWFLKNKSKHQLTDKEVNVVVNKILSY